ncbi:MAG: RNA polymerase sigma-70 factor [Bacteroidota bacterium]|nr:RNA polymerase sigma-70 factor [Bacteroidota bacterium]
MEKSRRIKGSFSDKSFFEEIFKKYFVALTYYALKLVNDHDSAKDIVHQVFINIWEKRGNINLDQPIRSYLYTSVHNRCMNYIRDNGRFHPDDVSDTEIHYRVGPEEPDLLEQQETEARIAQAIAKLPQRCGEVFRLKRFENKKYSEIAEIMKISVKTVEAQMSKSLRILRKDLKDLLMILIFLIANKFL